MRINVVLLGLLLPLALWATVPFTANIEAIQECPAYHSIKKASNPNNLYLKKGTLYPVVAKNRPDASHYLIIINDSRRWVEVGCGELSDQKAKMPKTTSRGREFLLALSWQNAFCEGYRSKKECKTQTPSRYDATHFVLHGLWPQPKNNAYCGVSTKDKTLDHHHRWDMLPNPHLNHHTYKELKKVMPAVVSNLHRHEWIKHGSCYGSNAQKYFEDSIQLTNLINNSKVGQLFTSHIGKTLRLSKVQQVFEQEFGQGSGDKIQLRCKNGMIVELWINLKGSIKDDTLSTLLKDAKATQSRCDKGVVDRAGY